MPLTQVPSPMLAPGTAGNGPASSVSLTVGGTPFNPFTGVLVRAA